MMSGPGIDDRELILRYLAGELNPSVKQWVEQRLKEEKSFRLLFELYGGLEEDKESGNSKAKPTSMNKISFTPPEHKRPKPRKGVLIFLIVLLILVLLAILLI